MALKFYNTLIKQKEKFQPTADKKVGMFVCGPTVYGSPHIGHARTYVVFDILAKWLRNFGYKVKYVQNITDIDDKIINRAREEGKTPKEVAAKYEKEYMEGMKMLGISSVTKYVRASDKIKNIIKQIKTLIDKGYAYVIENDGVYFDISKFSDYGKLSGRTAEQAEDAVSRVDESVNKRNKGDFALWKFSKPGEPVWSFETGQGLKKSGSTQEQYRLVLRSGLLRRAAHWDGRPGWHIEDTAITEEQLGQQYDIHCGARDLIFPHHEAEIAQQESASGKKPFVKYWLHSGFLTINGQKMSKSLGNFITIRQILKNYPPEALRHLFLSTHYRSPIDYKEETLKQSEAAIERIREFITKLESLKGRKLDPSLAVDSSIKEVENKINEAMNDDLNTPQAIAAIFDLIREVNTYIDRKKLDKSSGKKIIKFLNRVDKIFGIIPKYKKEIPNEIKKLGNLREDLRQEKRYSEADDIRNRIISKGYTIDDTPHGPLIKKR